VRKIGESAKKILVPEMNLGQLYHSVKEAVGYNAEVIKFSKIGGTLHSPQDIVEFLKEEKFNV
jgi:2-oxoglutarate ferredoxin oxidoreductase subunit alpha